MASSQSSYTPEIGAKVFELMSQGYSIVGAAGKIGIGRQTIYDWQNQHESFRALMEKAKAARQAHWEQEALETTSGARVTMITKALGGMRSPDWSDDSRLEITGANGQPLIQTVAFKILDSKIDEPLTIEGEVVDDE